LFDLTIITTRADLLLFDAGRHRLLIIHYLKARTLQSLPVSPGDFPCEEATR